MHWSYTSVIFIHWYSTQPCVIPRLCTALSSAPLLSIQTGPAFTGTGKAAQLEDINGGLWQLAFSIVTLIIFGDTSGADNYMLCEQCCYWVHKWVVGCDSEGPGWPYCSGLSCIWACIASDFDIWFMRSLLFWVFEISWIFNCIMFCTCYHCWIRMASKNLWHSSDHGQL